MNETHLIKITSELNLNLSQIKAVADLLADGATIPFIARYRKEVTGSLDEVAVTEIRDRLKQLAELDDRRQSILKSLEQHGHLTDDLREKVEAAETLAKLEDLYLPYKPKRRTKATIAREKGLAPLAEMIFAQTGIEPDQTAEAFVDPEKGVSTAEEAMAGARDIIAEMINENEAARSGLRQLFEGRATIKSSVVIGKEDAGAKFRDYFDWEEPIAQAPSHRILAMRRGEKEDVLNLTIAPPKEAAIELLESLFLKGSGADTAQVRAALEDSYKRLLSRSMETEVRLMLKDRADGDAIKIFADNLRQLMLAAPLGAKRVMGVDPGFRTGCKIVCLDRQGKLLHHDTIYPHLSEKKSQEAADKVLALCRQYEIEAIAVGNGTAGRETEAFLGKIGLPTAIRVLMVNESGASIYSASEVAREEFPDQDVTVRGSVSIARRLMDPLAELVKIDPKSIGVGQYQHDVDQAALRDALDDVVMSCVNAVGVDLNRASVQLLTYVSGLGPQLAKNIVSFRNENGPFASRKKLVDVPRLGPKAFEQAAGFLRIHHSENPLDASAVHPESYHIVESMARNLDCTVNDLIKSEVLRKQITLSDYITETTGLPTLQDILSELAKPGRDPRDAFETFAFAEGVQSMQDLEIGMKLPGIVTNITAFGAFVDIGVHQDGLVHVSQLADRFVKDPAEIVKVHQQVAVRILEVDIPRKRISLSMKSQPEVGSSPSSKPRKTESRRGASAKPRPNRSADKKFSNNPFADVFRKMTP